MKPFDLEKALAGDPVVTRNGNKVTELKLFKDVKEYPLVCVIEGTYYAYSIDGQLNTFVYDTSLDLFMDYKSPKKEKRWIVVFDKGKMVSMPCKCKELLISRYSGHDAQIIEIEIEVE